MGLHSSLLRFNLQSLLKPCRHNSQKLNMPKGSGLTKPMKLSAELADIVGKKEASRAECIKQLWAYIKKQNLQDPENKQFQPRQEDGQDLWQRQDSCFRYGQVLERSPLIDIGPFFPNNFHFHPFTKFIYNSSNSTPISKNGRQRTYGDVSGTTDFTPNCCGCRRYYSLPPSEALNK